MRHVNDAQLQLMSVKELRELKQNIDAAIRSAIARSRNTVSRSADSDKPVEPKKLNLEQERDAWQAARR
jgi:hypothetical protein